MRRVTHDFDFTMEFDSLQQGGAERVTLFWCGAKHEQENCPRLAKRAREPGGMIFRK